MKPVSNFICSLFAGLDSDLGGTEILEPLEAVLKLPTIKEYHRQVFVLTDGTVR